MQLSGKVIVITGAAQGIGKAMAQRFKQESPAGLVLADRSDAVEAVASELGAKALTGDLSQASTVERLVALAEGEFGRIDLMCSNAGIFRGDGSGGRGAGWNATTGSLADWQASWDINVMAHVHAARAALPGMVKRGEGYFLHTASAAGLLNQIGSAIYGTTKHAAVGFAEALAIAHGDQGIRVSVLCPQAVRTPMLGGGGESSAAAGDGIVEPEDLAECVVSGLAEERFLILPHPEVATYMKRKADDYERWLRGMQRLRQRLSGG
ncbi:MAG: SDR family NAD(P)-dependent oxidoreductase [Myxococcales bacterium]|nr:SDR family NAD(P)-dependent oxidoreductase [Myxococcales bacterium]MDD9967981.1 SDR family NAD(P)-dependent oxidoreductase [Myxococcales bacterium]